MPKIIIGLTGSMNAGKDTASKIIEGLGFEHIVLSNIIRQEVIKRGLEINREHLQDVGNALRKEHGLHVLAKLALDQSKSDKVLIDGIRNLGEVEYLRKNFKFYLISIDAPFDMRYKNALKRKGEKDLISIEEFKRLDDRDKGLNEPLNGQRVADCMAQADFTLINDEYFTDVKKSKLYYDTLRIYDAVIKDTKDHD